MSFNKKTRILMVGFGAMGSALYESFKGIDWLKITIVSPHLDVDELSRVNPDVRFVLPDNLGDEKFDYVIFAVKPQVMCEALSLYKKNIEQKETIIISIAAGFSIKSVNNCLGFDDSAKIVRMMPNTPAQIGEGVLALYSNEYVGGDDKSKIKAIFAESSKVVVELKDEEDFHLVTAFTGSGPAYVFYFIESLLSAVNNLSLSNDDKILMAEQLVAGSALYAKSMFGDKNLETLRQNVTSPNGTTQAGLNVLMDGRFCDIIKDAVKAAKDRSIELSKM